MGSAINNRIYDELADAWWDENSFLHLLKTVVNPWRVPYFTKALQDSYGQNLKPVRLLDIGCGGGVLAEEFSRLGCRVSGIDISPHAISGAMSHAARGGLSIDYVVSSALSLPFVDNSFDACYHFGGINAFGDIKRAFSEMARVTKPGGKVVVGDESMPPWLRETEFSRILINSNPEFAYTLPLDKLPVEARKTRLEWIIGGVFYVIDFVVGVGEPTADFDFPIPGVRGGTHRTRFYGQLEGVTPETKHLAQEARAKTGKSMHQWLDDVVRQAAMRDIGLKD